MYLVGLATLLGTIAVFAATQARYIDAYFERFGGPTRAERQEMFFSRPGRYLRLLRGGAPFGFRAMFRRSGDGTVDQRRREVIASAALIIIAACYSSWATITNRYESYPAISAVGGLLACGVWTIVLFRADRSTWLWWVSPLGIVAGIVVFAISVAS
jgi:drug/metabolite transporter (DMT)-like permease